MRKDFFPPIKICRSLVLYLARCRGDQVRLLMKDGMRLIGLRNHFLLRELIASSNIRFQDIINGRTPF